MFVCAGGSYGTEQRVCHKSLVCDVKGATEDRWSEKSNKRQRVFSYRQGKQCKVVVSVSGVWRQHVDEGVRNGSFHICLFLILYFT